MGSMATISSGGKMVFSRKLSMLAALETDVVSSKPKRLPKLRNVPSLRLYGSLMRGVSIPSLTTLWEHCGQIGANQSYTGLTELPGAPRVVF